MTGAVRLAVLTPWPPRRRLQDAAATRYRNLTRALEAEAAATARLAATSDDSRPAALIAAGVALGVGIALAIAGVGAVVWRRAALASNPARTARSEASFLAT